MGRRRVVSFMDGECSLPISRFYAIDVQLSLIGLLMPPQRSSMPRGETTKATRTKRMVGFMITFLFSTMLGGVLGFRGNAFCVKRWHSLCLQKKVKTSSN